MKFSKTNLTRGTLKKRWNLLIEGSANRRIFGTVTIIVLLTIFIKIVVLGKDVMVAHMFGAGDDLEAFLIAMLPIVFIIQVFPMPFNGALIPIYIQVQKREGNEAAHQLSLTIIVISFLFLASLTAILTLLAPYFLPFLGAGFSQSKIVLTQTLFYFLVPGIIIQGMASICSSFLNAREKFFWITIYPLMWPVLTILILILYYQSLGIYALAIGSLLGTAGGLCLLGWGMKKEGFTMNFPKQESFSYGRQIIKKYWPLVVGAFLFASTPMVDQAMAAMLQPGSVATLNFGKKIPEGIQAITGLALSTVMLPYFSKMIEDGNETSVTNTLKYSVRLIFILSIPVIIFFSLWSEPLIGIIFERGKFTAENTQLVAEVQRFYILQIPFNLLAGIYQRAILALKFNKIIMLGAIASFFLNIYCNYIFMKTLGVIGIAVSTVLVFMISSIFYSVIFYRKIKNI